jgi:5-oxoprolinase (ATP-hydrolysing)
MCDNMAGQWHFRVDRGGTFTDIIARRPDGRLVTCKLLSENPEQYTDAVLAGIRHLLQIGRNDLVPAALIGSIRMGTTVATNALLEHKGEPVLLVVTRGFADVLRIGYQSRPDLFALDIRLPQMLYASVIEVDERLDANGHVLRDMDERQVRTDLQSGFNAGLRSCAIVLMHSYRNADHENRIAALARAIGFTRVSVSSRLSPVMKIVSRGDTTAVDAYLSPILQRYIAQVSGQLQGLAEQPGRLLFMQSNGGLTDARFFNGKDAILSGPAGGVIGMVKTGEAAGFNRLIGFDMGGTSTDVCHYRGAYERTTESVVAGFRLQTPMLAVHTIAAGGGSIVRFDGARYRVGPESAGAVPGPTCYRRGGPLTITDCNVMLGKIRPEYFPAVFGPAGDQPLDSVIVRQQFERLAEDIRRQTGG